jgi:hypothetical protein
MKSKLIDTTPNTAYFSDAPLTVGRSFVDPISDITITTVAADSGAATVKVDFGGVATPTPTPTGSPIPTPTRTPTATPTPTRTPSPTGDTQPPSAPTSLTVHVLDGQFVLQWSASTDNSGSVRYDVFENGTKVATTEATTWTTRARGRQTYQVRAVDRAGNASSLTAPVLATDPKRNN